MILLLGGTSETGAIAAALADAGLAVLVSTATDEPLTLPAGVQRRVGRLDAQAMATLTRDRGVRAIVDATHPFATAAHAAAREAARLAEVACVRYARPGGASSADQRFAMAGEGAGGSSSSSPAMLMARDHAHAAELAFSFGGDVLLTTGSTHLKPYCDEARRTGLRLAARVLPRAESLAACRAAGLHNEQIIAAKGPFTVEHNREHLRRAGAAVLVTKDSGAAGGLDAKLEAARLEGCRVVCLAQPAGNTSDCRSAAEVVSRVRLALGMGGQ